MQEKYSTEELRELTEQAQAAIMDITEQGMRHIIEEARQTLTYPIAVTVSDDQGEVIAMRMTEQFPRGQGWSGEHREGDDGYLLTVMFYPLTGVCEGSDGKTIIGTIEQPEPEAVIE
jgi:hypothetical protein